MHRYIATLLALLLLLFGPSLARAGFQYEWHGTVTSALSFGMDEFGNVGGFASPIGGPITVSLSLDGTYVPGELYDPTQLVDVLVLLPADTISPWPFEGPAVLGFMPKLLGSGSLGINAGVGILGVHDEAFNLSWEHACLSDVNVNLFRCSGLEVLGTGGPWTLVDSTPASEPSGILLLIALISGLVVRPKLRAV